MTVWNSNATTYCAMWLDHTEMGDKVLIHKKLHKYTIEPLQVTESEIKWPD